jgi:cyclophilin family peptidyl-prolyl cis-trans isomerase
MKSISGFFASLFLLFCFSVQAQPDIRNLSDGIYAVFGTNKGSISVKLDYKKAPMTTANFIGLAEGSITNSTYPAGTPFFSGSIWHRVVKGHVIQGGEPSVVKDPANYEGNSTGYEIPNEITELSHKKAGMIGMANGGPNTATCEYYITLGDRSYLDGNYTLFGEVVEGMDVVNNIEKGDTTKSVTIVRVGRDAGSFIVNDQTFKSLVDRQWAKVKAESEARKAETEKYISSTYRDLTILPGGLCYKILAKGKGEAAKEGQMLKASYTGSLINGTRFVSSADAAKPAAGTKAAEFTLKTGDDLAIKSLPEILKQMKAGEKRVLIIPSELGLGTAAPFYGKDIAGQKRLVISPGETIILELTLIKIYPAVK